MTEVQQPQPAPAPPQLAKPTPPKWIWLIIGWLLPAAILGVPYFSAPYSKVGSSGVVWGWGLLVIAATALVLRATGNANWWQAAAAPLAGLLTVVVSRIAADTVIDPTTHNLWPFEVAIALALGGAAAVAGAMLGVLVARVLKR